MRDGVAAVLLKCVAVIYFGVGCQRVAVAVPVEAAGLFAISNSSQARTGPELLASVSASQELGAGGEVPAGQGAMRPGLPAAPQEIIRTTRQPSSKQRRRKPRMAGVPSGLQTVLVQAPEPALSTAVTQTAATQETQKASVPAASQVVGRVDGESASPAVRKELPQEDEDEDMNSPGAIARRKAEHTQGLVERQYRRAPIKWGGTVTETVTWRNTSTLGVPASALTQIYHVQTVMVGAQTYIMQPWIASVLGRIGVVSGSHNSSYVGGSNYVRENSLIGGGALSLFARSRFPFALNYDVTDSRANEGKSGGVARAETSSLNSVSKRLNLDQTYRPLNGIDFYKLSYNLDDTTDRMLGDQRRIPVTTKNTNATLNGEYSTKLGSKHDQPFELTAGHFATNSTNSQGGAASTRTGSILARHTYMPEDSLLTIKSDGSFFQSTRPDTVSRNFMLATRGSWQPEDEDIPLIMKGSAQLFQAQNVVKGIANKSQILSANVDGTYNAWEHVSLSGGAGVIRSKVGRTPSLITTQFVNAAYNPGVISIGNGMPYSRSGYAGILNQTSSPGGANLAVYGGANHSLAMPYEFSLFGYGSRISPNISQGVSARVDRLSGASETLTHSGSIAWSPGLRKNLPRIDEGGTDKIRTRTGGTARLFNNVTFALSDSRTFGRAPAHIRTMRLSGTLNGLGQYKTSASGYGGNANMSVQVSRQSGRSSTTLVGNADWAYQYAYDYTYKKKKIFDVRGLDYTLDFKANAGTGLNAGGGRTDGQSTRASNYRLTYGFAFDQTLRYRIGQNEALLTASLADTYGTKTASLFLLLRAWRNFGN